LSFVLLEGGTAHRDPAASGGHSVVVEAKFDLGLGLGLVKECGVVARRAASLLAELRCGSQLRNGIELVAGFAVAALRVAADCPRRRRRELEAVLGVGDNKLVAALDGDAAVTTLEGLRRRNSAFLVVMRHKSFLVLLNVFCCHEGPATRRNFLEVVQREVHTVLDLFLLDVNGRVVAGGAAGLGSKSLC
jgi:hypothetical protein